jgi:ATP-binding cassette subfamily B multidrug efflux pump
MSALRDYSMFDGELAGKAFDGRLLRRLLHWLRPHWRWAAWSAVLVLVASVLAIMMPVIVTRVVIDGLLVSAQPLMLPDFGMNALAALLTQASGLQPLLAACLLYMLVTTGWTVCAHYHRVYLAKAVLGALRDLRYDLFAHLETRPAAFYDRVAVGRVMTRVTNDVEVLFQLLSGFGVLLGEFVPFLAALTLMLLIDAQLTGILMLALPVVALATYLFRKATRTVYRTIRQSISQLNQNLQENIAGIQVVQLNRREERNLDRYSDINRGNRHEEDRAVGVETLYGGFMDSMASVAVGVILWFGGGSVLQETISLGSVVLFTQFIDMLFRPIVAVGEQYNVLFRAMASAERIFQALDWDESVREPENPVEISGELRGALEVRHLTFGYTPGQNVLHDVSFEISPGEKLAIVGATGSGKSTIIRLLGRFYDIESEQIFLDGVDITNIPSHELRRRIGIVLQDFHVFSGSVADNISLGNPSISRAKVIDAARHVNAERFIGRLAQGYDTPLAERGANLSQGQRQLLAFARVLAADPEILVLDEATASIDTETELLIQEAIRTLTEGRTSIIIAHRLQTIREADRILVLNDGRVAEIGNHDELLAAGGIYRKLYSLQFQESVAE